MSSETLGVSAHELPPDIGKLERILDAKLARKQFHLDEGETEEMVIARTELIRAALEEAPRLAGRILEEARRILDEAGIPEERTGQLACFLVGGRVRADSNLKTWSDFDLIVAAEKPFSPSRKATNPPIPPEVLAELPAALIRPDQIRLAKELQRILHEQLLPEVNERLSAKLGRTVDVSNASTGPDAGLFGIDGFGEQRPQEMADKEQYFMLA